jgi:hypothetical protein
MPVHDEKKTRVLSDCVERELLSTPNLTDRERSSKTSVLATLL